MVERELLGARKQTEVPAERDTQEVLADKMLDDTAAPDKPEFSAISSAVLVRSRL